MNTILLLILLQAVNTANDIPNGVFDTILQYGVLGAALIVFVYLYFAERKKNNDNQKAEKERMQNDFEKERIRMLASIDNGEQKAEVLYNELKEAQKGYAEKLSNIIIKQNEIQERTVEVLEKHNNLYEKIINILIKLNS